MTPLEADVIFDDLDQYLLDRHLRGSWMRRTRAERPLVMPERRSGASALHWRWSDMYPGLLRAGSMVPVGPSGLTEMRSVTGVGAASKPIYMNAQVLMPGERTRAHHNMKNETRLVYEAPKDAAFVCDGEAFPMERGDVIVTPSWSDHDHYNDGDEPAIWIDGYDSGYSSLGNELNTRYPEDDPYQVIRRDRDYALATRGRVQPKSATPGGLQPRPAVRYPWAETIAALDALRSGGDELDLFDGYQVMLVSPVDGGPTLPTMAWHAQLLPAGFRSRRHRHNSTACYHAFDGEGATTINDECIEWSSGDLFVVPPWTWHSHHNAASSTAMLFSIDDWPARSKLGFYAKEEEETP